MIIVSLVGGSWRQASGASTDFMVSIDVPADQAPQFLCVVAETPSCPSEALAQGRVVQEQSCRTRELVDLVDAKAVQIGANAREARFAPVDLAELNRKHPGAGLTPNLTEALKALAQPSSDRCDEAHSGCAPSINLIGHLDDHGVPRDRIICGRDPASSSQRVAMLSLKFHDQGIAIGDVELHGTSAVLKLKAKVDPGNGPTMHVIGGHYVASAREFNGSADSATVVLQPRCTLFQAELPPQPLKPIDTVVLTTDAPPADPSACTTESTRPIRCKSYGHGELPIQIPYNTTARRTTLSVTTARDDHAGPSTFEASWTDALPSRPLRLGVRSLEFSWQRDCLSGAWPEKARPQDKTWSAGCPQATIAGAGAPCQLIDDNAQDCRYRCSALGSLPFALPTEVQFDRMRASGSSEPNPETLPQPVYSWHDTLHAADEQLHSYAARADRRLFLELEQPKLWVDHGGETYDELRTVLPDGSIANVDLTRTRTGARTGERLRWYEIKAPDIACTDRVRVVVFGSHIYDEQTYAVDGGQIRLARPEDSLSHGNLWLTGGVGILNERLPGPPDRFAAAALLGGHFEWYAWLGALEAGVIAQGTETDVIGTDAARKPTVLDAVPYLRFDLQAGYELWPWRSLHFGGSAGLGLGFPVSNDDHVKVAVLRPSLVAELNSRIRLAHHVGRWSEIAAGVRLGEAHRVFPALDLTAPARIVRPVQLYVALRLWFLIG